MPVLLNNDGAEFWKRRRGFLYKIRQHDILQRPSRRLLTASTVLQGNDSWFCVARQGHRANTHNAGSAEWQRKQPPPKRRCRIQYHEFQRKATTAASCWRRSLRSRETLSRRSSCVYVLSKCDSNGSPHATGTLSSRSGETGFESSLTTEKSE